MSYQVMDRETRDTKKPRSQRTWNRSIASEEMGEKERRLNEANGDSQLSGTKKWSKEVKKETKVLEKERKWVKTEK